MYYYIITITITKTITINFTIIKIYYLQLGNKMASWYILLTTYFIKFQKMFIVDFDLLVVASSGSPVPSCVYDIATSAVPWRLL